MEKMTTAQEKLLVLRHNRAEGLPSKHETSGHWQSFLVDCNSQTSLKLLFSSFFPLHTSWINTRDKKRCLEDYWLNTCLTPFCSCSQLHHHPLAWLVITRWLGTSFGWFPGYCVPSSIRHETFATCPHHLDTDPNSLILYTFLRTSFFASCHSCQHLGVLPLQWSDLTTLLVSWVGSRAHKYEPLCGWWGLG